MAKKRKYANYYLNSGDTEREESLREIATEDFELIVQELCGDWQQQKEEYDNITKPETRKQMLEETNRRKAEEARTFRKNFEDRKEIYINIIIDGTYSFSNVFLKVDYVIEHIVRMISEEKLEFRGIVIKYGLTVLHEEGEPCIFRNGEYFTESEDELLQKILDIELYGGSDTGRENLNDAMNSAIRILNKYSTENAYKGLIMFSDSLPEYEDMYPDFLQDDQNGYINKGLRFAVIYTYNGEFMPKLKMVDGDGCMIENGKNEVIFNSMEDLLSSGEDEIIKNIQQIVNDILNQTSVRI